MTEPTPLEQASVSGVEPTGPFEFRWPEGTEQFETGWTYELTVGGQNHEVRHGLGGREVYGRERVHTVTWLGGQVQVEGVEADDYPVTGSLVSLLRNLDKKLIRTIEEVPTDYGGFDIVDHRREVDAKWSRNCQAVKIPEDDLVRWGVHAWLRSRQRSRTVAGIPGPPTVTSPSLLLPPLLTGMRWRQP